MTTNNSNSATQHAWGSDGSNDAAVRCWGRCHHDSWSQAKTTESSESSPRVMATKLPRGKKREEFTRASGQRFIPLTTQTRPQVNKRDHRSTEKIQTRDRDFSGTIQQQHTKHNTDNSTQQLAKRSPCCASAAPPRAAQVRRASEARRAATRQGEWGFLRAHEIRNKCSITKRCSAA